VTDTGNFEHGRTVLYRAAEPAADERARFEAARQALFLERGRRVRPGRDENVIAGWNAMMIEGLCAAYQATGTDRFLQAARGAADFIDTRMKMPDGGVYRAWRDGLASVGGFLDDYAVLANALLDLYESCFEQRYLERAVQLVDRILSGFWDDGLFLTAGDGEALIHRPRAPYDTAWPSGTSTAVFAMFRLHAMTGSTLYRERADEVVRMFQGAAVRNAFGFAHLLAAAEFAQCGPSTIVLAGRYPAVRPLLEPVHRAYLPARTLALAEHVPIGSGRGPVDGKPAAYVCRHQTCGLPVTTAAELMKDIGRTEAN